MPRESSPDRRLDHALEKTVASDDFSAEALRRELEQTDVDTDTSVAPQSFLIRTETDTPTPSVREETTGLGGFGDTTGVPAKLIADEDRGGPRFKIVDEVGSGGTSRVYAVQDRSLNRTVALKLLRGARAAKPGVEQRFIHEARVTAMLEHPNVMPVHDIGTTDNGRVYFTMKNITGASLGDAIRAEKKGATPPEDFRTLNGKIGIFLKVCDALSFAHDKGFIHQDVKPDNIMLGEYGEVLLLDWGCALTAAEAVGQGNRAAYGTPAYMSPEQARREAVDERSDVYCLGATISHALTLRHPTWSDDPERFWEKKREGAIDELSDQERRRVPKTLRAIIMKALDPDPGQRYQTVAGFSRDLERFQAGQAVLAYHESPLEAFMRWYVRHRRIFWSTTAATVLILGVGGLLFREKLKEMLTWKLVFSEDFSRTTTADLDERWRATAFGDWRTAVDDTPGKPGGTWTVRDGALFGKVQGDGCHDIALAEPIHGDLRVEWTATSLRNGRNLNAFIGGANRREGYTFHVGGFGDRARVALTRGATDMRLDFARLPEPIQIGTTYHFRMEREGYNVRLYVNDVKMIDYVDLDVLSGEGHQTFGFDVTNGSDLRIDNIRVYHHPLPQKVSPLATPKHFEDEGQYENALSRYRSLQHAYPGTDIAARATFREARCLQHMDSIESALQAYEAFETEFPRHALVPLSAFQRSQMLTDHGRLHAADSVYALLARRYGDHPVARTIVATLTERAATALTERERKLGRDPAGDTATIAWCLRTAERVQRWCTAFDVPVTDNTFLDECAKFLLSESVGLPFDSVAKALSTQQGRLAGMLMGWGNAQRIAREYPRARKEAALALVEAGRYEDVINKYPDCDSAAALALLALDRPEEVLERYPRQRVQCARALIRLGRLQEVAEEYADAPDQCSQALFMLGRHEQCIERILSKRDFAIASVLVSGRIDLLPDLDLDRRERVIVANRLLHQPAHALTILRQNRWRLHRDIYGYQIYETHMHAGTLREALDSGALSVNRWWMHATLELGLADELMARVPWNRAMCIMALRQMGLYDSCLALTSVRISEAVETLSRAGRNEEILARYSSYPRYCAQALLRLGRYEQVLATYPYEREACAEALYRLGRYDEVVSRYPEQRVACFKAVALLRGEDEAYAAYSEQRALYAQRLLQLGRYERLCSALREQTTAIAIARTRQGRRNDVTFDSGVFQVSRQGRHEVLSVWALRDWVHGRRAKALEHLAARPPVYYRERGRDHAEELYLRFGRYLLLPVLRAFSGDDAALARAADSIEADCRYLYSQQLHHEAAYLAGRITDEGFLAQPHGDSAQIRLRLFRALRDDLRGSKKEQSRQVYAELLDTPFPDGLLCSHALRELLRWRLGRDTAISCPE